MADENKKSQSNDRDDKVAEEDIQTIASEIDDSTHLVRTGEKQEWENPDRDRGIFTPHDRKYILGKTELSGQDERNARYRIRQRLIQGLYDLQLIDFIRNEDLSQVVEETDLLTGRAGVNLAVRLMHIDDEIDFPKETLEKQVQESVSDNLSIPQTDSNVTRTVVDVNIDISHEEIDRDEMTDELGISEEEAERVKQIIKETDDVELEYNFIRNDSKDSDPENTS